MQMSTNNYLKFITEEFVKYFNNPKEIRKKRREEKQEQTFYSNRWFGVIPFSFKMFLKK